MKTMLKALLLAWAFLALPALAEDLKSPDAFNGIQNQDERSIAFFLEAGKVITSPRCVNCHPAGDRPLQGKDSHLHQPLVVRGDGGLGAVGMRCYTCHGQQNYDPAHIPGHPEWHLAPIEMAWQGKTLGQICEQIKDRARNGGRDMVALIAQGLASRGRTRSRARDSTAVWGIDQGLGRYRRHLPKGIVVHCCNCWRRMVFGGARLYPGAAIASQLWFS
jgi:hypothetical protein